MPWQDPIKACCLIPQRYILGFMGFAAVINAYTMRNCLSVTITEMVQGAGHVTEKEEIYKWTEPQQGVVLGAFYWGYVIMHVPGGIIADKYGGKYPLGIGIFITAVLTLFTPIIIYEFEYYGIIVVRICEGLGEGTTFPALTVLLSRWIPVKDRAKYACLVFAGSQIGTVIANLSAGFIIEWTGTWSAVFYVFGSIGLSWCIAWQMLCFNTPTSHPYIRDKELEYLVSNQADYSKEKPLVPWFGLVTSLPIYSLIVAQIGHDWVFFAMVTDLPKYMKAALNLTVAKNGAYSALPYLVMWICSLLSGVLADWILKKKYVSVGTCRKIFTTVGAVCPAVFIVCASYAGRNIILVVGCFVIAMATMGPYYAGLKVNAMDLTSNYSGVVIGLVNGIGALSGIITPYVIGVIIAQPGDILLKWRLVFWITLGVTTASSVLYIIFAKGDEQWWNNPESYKAIRDTQKAEKQTKIEAKKAAKAEKQAAKAERARIKKEEREARRKQVP